MDMLKNYIIKRIVLTSNKKFLFLNETEWQNKKSDLLTQEKDAESSIHVFKKICNILNELEVNYWITNGTLLGVIRDKKLIPWDSDADFIVKNLNFSTIEKLVRKLEQNDFTIVIRPGIIYIKINAFKDGFKCSITEVRTLGNFYFDSTWYLKKSWVGEPQMLSLSKEINTKVKIPEHPKIILSKFYRDWNIPVKSEDPLDYILYETLIKEPLRTLLRTINLIPSIKDIRSFSLLKRVSAEYLKNQK